MIAFAAHISHFFIAVMCRYASTFLLATSKALYPTKKKTVILIFNVITEEL